MCCVIFIKKMYSKNGALIFPEPLVGGSNGTAVTLVSMWPKESGSCDRTLEGVRRRERADGRNRGLVKPFSSPPNPLEAAASWLLCI